MFHVSQSLSQEHNGGASAGDCKANSALNNKSLPVALKWVAPDGQLFMWERLMPFSAPSWRCMKSVEARVAAEHSCLLKQQRFREDIAMDARIWSALPEDVMEKVLAWLPLTTVLRFRSVCRRWNSFVSSGTFLNSHSERSPHRPCFLLCTIGQLACSYDPSLRTWLTLLKPTSPGVSVVASSGSLFCLGNQVTECKMLSVCNPITRCLKHLPPMLRVCLIHKVTMIEERSTNSYKIVVAGEDGLPTPNPHTFDLMAEVYDSSTNAWKMAGDPLPDAKFGSDPGVWWRGLFYCLTEMPYGVVMFDPKTGLWCELSLPMPAAIAIPSLLTVKNRLLMVGRSVTPHPHNRTKTTAICIWELQLQGAWQELVRVPSTLCSKFLAPQASYSPFVCVGVGNSIFLTTHLNPEVLVYDITNDSWGWLPSDPLFPNNRDFHLLGFAFEPRFDACP